MNGPAPGRLGSQPRMRAASVATAVMGFAEPRAPSGVAPFESCENHLLLADEAGLGTADLGRSEVRGLSIAEARYPYR